MPGRRHGPAMGTIVDASVPAEQFALGDTFEEVPGAEFEVVRVVAYDAGRVMPFLWGSAAEQDALYAALEADTTTEGVQRLAGTDDRSLYQVEWDGGIETVVSVLVEGEGTLLGAKGQDGQWTIQALFPDHDAISLTFDFCKDRGIDLSIRRVNGVTDSISDGGVGLSTDQLEALTVAFETDYYAVPRGMTLEALASELGVSHQALSERLRRGHRNLIANTLFDPPEPVRRTP